MADPKDPKILRDAEGFPFPDERPDDDSRRVRGLARGEPTIPSELGTAPLGDDAAVFPPLDCGRGKVWSVEEQRCIDDPNLDNFDNPNFDFMDCEPSDANLEPPEECEVCIKDPLAFVPEWKRLANEEVFFDGKECLYSAVVHDINLDSWRDTKSRPGSPAELVLRDRLNIANNTKDADAKIRGLELIFEFLQKAEVVKAAEFLPKEETAAGRVTSGLFPLVPGARESGKYTREEKDINMIDELLKLKNVVKVERVVSIRPEIPTKFLVNIPVEYAIELPDVVVADIPSEIPVDDPLKVQFMGKDIKEKFHVMANSLNGTMAVYHRQYQLWLRQGGGVFKKTKYNSETERFEVTGKNFRLDLQDHAEKMRDFLDELSSLLGTQGLIIPGFGFELRTQGPNVEKVVINIENVDKAPGGKLRIKNVKANKKGCELVVFSENRPATKHFFKKFERKFRNSTLLAYIGQVPNMCLDSQARDPSEWFDWVVSHTYPPVEIQLGLNATDPASEASLASCALGGLIGDPVEDILNSLGEELGSVLKTKFSETICLSRDELEKLKKDRKDAVEAAQKEIARLRLEVLPPKESELAAKKEELKKLKKDPNYKQQKKDAGQELVDAQAAQLAEQLVLLAQEIAAAETDDFRRLKEKEYKAVEKEIVKLAKKKPKKAQPGTATELEKEVEDLEKEVKKIKDQIKEAKIFMSKDLTERMRGVSIGTEMQKYMATNPLFEKLPKLLESFAKKGKKSKRNLWKDVIKKMGPCGMLALLAEAMECLMKGIPLEDAKKKLVEAALKAMDNVNLEKIFIGLPPDKQAEVLAKIGEEFKDVDPPWKDPYRDGTYSGSGWNKGDLRDDVLQSQGGKTQAELEKIKEESNKLYNKTIKELAGGNLKEEKKARREASKSDLFDKEGRILPGGGIQQDQKQGSLAMAATDAQGVIFDAYKDAILELVGIDYLFDQLNNLPGAKLIAELIKDIPCKTPPPWRIDPPLGEFFKFEKLDPCDLLSTTGVWQIPPRIQFKKPVNIQYIKQRIWEFLREVAEEMIFITKLLVIKAIIDIIVRLICLALTALGAALTDLLTGSNSLMDILKNELCGAGAKDEAIEESITGLLDTFSGPEGSCLETMDPSEIGDFIDSISATLLQTEMLDLLQGTASPDVLEMVSQLAALSGSPCVAELFSDPNNVADLFRNLGNMVDLSELENLVNQLEGDPIYVSPNICADPLALESLDKIRCYLLSGKGLTEEECQEEIDKLKNQALDDLGALADILHGNGPSSPPTDSTGPNPCGPEDGIYPYNSPAALSAQAALTDAMFEDLAIAHSRDLLGAGGFLTMVLSDTNGKGLKSHNFWVKYFGSSEVKYLSTIQWYTDDAIAVLDQEAPQGQGGKKLKGTAGNGGSALNKIPKVNVSTGGFPPTVASWLKESMANLGDPSSVQGPSPGGQKKPGSGGETAGSNVNRLFNTTTIPGGYNSMEEANEAELKRERQNNNRIELRSDYIEAFITVYDLDIDTDRKGKKRSSVASKLRRAITGELGPLFAKNNKGEWDESEEPPGIKKNDERYLAREVLRGKQILGGTGDNFAQIDKKKGLKRHLDDRWDNPNDKMSRRSPQMRSRAAKSSKRNKINTYFTDMWTQSDEWAKSKWELLPPIDLSSADLRLTFEDYLGEYSLKVEYDPNLIDENGILMSYPVVFDPDAPEGRRLDNQGEEFVAPADDSYVLSVYEKFDSKDPEVGNNAHEQVSPPPTRLDAGGVFKRTHKIKGSLLADPEVVEYIDETLDIKTEMEKVIFGTSGFDISDKSKGLSKQGITFTSIIKNSLLERGVGDDAAQQFALLLRQNVNLINLNKEQRSEMFDEISDYYVKQIANRISQNSRSFDFGWKASDQPTVKILDPLKYGGSEEAPPFYLQPPKRNGWLGLVDDIIPEWDGCEPRRKDLIDFNSLKELVDQRNQSLTEDPRLQSDPLCVTEAPYDKIIDKYSFASIEGVMAATIRIYVAEMMLQGMPVFSLFHARIPENFDDVFLGYLVDKMEAGLIDEGTKFNLFKGQVVDKTYWYQFVEMAVKSYVSRLPKEYNPAGNGEILDPSPVEVAAYNNIAAAIETFYHIEKYEYDALGRPLAALTNNAISGQSLIKNIMEKRPASVRAAKNAPVVSFTKADARSAKEAAFNDILEETMDDAKVILRRLVREELERLAEQFNESIKPSIYSMDSLLLGNSDFIDGSLTDNKGNYRDPLPVLASDSGAEGTNVDPSGRRYRPDDADIEEQRYKKHFVLQKYIRIIDKESPSSEIEALRAPDMYGAVNIETWDRYVRSLKNSGLGGKISEWWGPGVTTETDADPTSETFGEELEIGESGWRFGVRICYVAQGELDKKLLRNITADPGITQALNEKAFQGSQILIPVAHGELEIPDQEFTNFDPASYDIDCLVAELIKDPAYKTLFNYCFPLKTFLSTLTIYCIKAFVPSIGNSGPPAGGGDRWVVPGGRALSGFRMWDGKKEPFRKSTRKARQQFEVLYNSTTKDNEYKDRSDNGAKQKFFDRLRPKWNYDLGLRWWMMPRLRPRPYDKNGNECE